MAGNTFKIIFLVGLTAYLFGIYGPSAQRYKRSKVTASRTRVFDATLDISMFLVWQVLPLIYVFAPWLDAANYVRPVWAGWIGAAIFAAALFLLWRAYADLGRNWSPKIDVLAGQKLVTDGIYRWIRHPIYAGIWLWSIAQPLLIHNWIALGMLVLFLPLYLIRVPREERMMLEHFGEEYRLYMNRTGRVIPRLSR
ncbi:MAG TPA: protein-S-isoprenylcysteine O-methyltransferase [Anaerolineae bacterium]